MSNWKQAKELLSKQDANIHNCGVCIEYCQGSCRKLGGWSVLPPDNGLSCSTWRPLIHQCNVCKYKNDNRCLYNNNPGAAETLPVMCSKFKSTMGRWDKLMRAFLGA